MALYEKIRMEYLISTLDVVTRASQSYNACRFPDKADAAALETHEHVEAALALLYKFKRELEIAMPIKNPNNGFLPAVDDKVRFVGNCHPAYFNKVGLVISVSEVVKNSYLVETMCYGFAGERLYTCGGIGGMVKVPDDTPISTITPTGKERVGLGNAPPE